ncbi:hypothetical protein [Pseudonocardia adelaidensis]|uniref:GntP family permease n=1 Tax=Pseudonocardia adelaidensis TaxID=648754 RepID=A0ABP9NDF2_9PSEU
MSGSFLATLPLLVLFVFVGRRMVAGILDGAFKVSAAGGGPCHGIHDTAPAARRDAGHGTACGRRRLDEVRDLVLAGRPGHPASRTRCRRSSRFP